MRVSLATESGRRDGRNEDWVGATSQLAIVLDGLSEGAETGCMHGTPWFVQQLGSRLITLAGDPERSLVSALEEAIIDVADSHSETCNLKHPGSPCTTVAMLREDNAVLEYLVLSDSMIVIDKSDGLLIVTDRSVETVATNETEAAYSVSAHDATHSDLHHAVINAQQRVRNQPGGYWVAQVDPSAAKHARTGTVARSATRSALVLSDGAARAVSDFHKLDWPDLIEAGHEYGPQGVIALTRNLEVQDSNSQRWPRYKVHDDASAIVCLVQDSSADLHRQLAELRGPEQSASK